MRRSLTSTLLALFLFAGCGVLGSDDGPSKVNECPVEAIEWSGKFDGRSGRYDKFYYELRNVADDPIQIQEGRLTFSLEDESDGEDLVFSLSVCCSITDEKIEPGKTVDHFDIEPHMEVMSGDLSDAFSVGYANWQDNIRVSDNNIPCKVFD
jgi:hypothetical protein